MPVTGSSLLFSCEMVHDGVMRLSAERNGSESGLVSLGTMIWTEMSVGVVRDILGVRYLEWEEWEMSSCWDQ